MNFSTVGLIVLEVVYGKKIIDTMGKDLLSWNIEEMHFYDEAFVKFWLVDMFHFRA